MSGLIDCPKVNFPASHVNVAASRVNVPEYTEAKPCFKRYATTLKEGLFVT